MSQLVPIGKVAEVNPTIPKTLNDSPDKIVTFLPMAAVSGEGKIVASEESLISTVIKGYRYFEQGDVLLAKITPCMENGKAAFVEDIPHKIGFGSTEFHVLRPSSEVDGRYLFYMVWSPIFRHIAKRNMTGTAGQRRVPTDFVKRYKIPLPPLEEQRRIAAILDKADAVRRKRQSAIALTEELLRSAFLEMFDTSVAKSWEMATVEQLLASKTGAIRTGPFGSQLLHSEFTSQGIAVLGIDNVVKNQFQWVQLRFISEKKYEQLKRYTVSPGDVLISIMGTCGRCAIVPDDCPKAINTKHLCSITLNRNKCYPEFLQSYFLIHPQASNYLKKNAKGAIMEGLNMSIIKDLPVPLVPIELQKQYVNLQRQILSSKASAIESKHEADNLFNSLLQRAFRGEL